MKKLKIITVCGVGLGTSLLAKMSIEEVLDKHNISYNVENADGTSAQSMSCDFFVTTSQFAGMLEGNDSPVVVVSNFMDQEEMETKIMEVAGKLMN